MLEAGTIAVVPGFIGRAADGSVTTLGRGGSDLTATLLGRALAAKRVVCWKDVPGILTADPRLVADARLIPQLHHREAAEVAHYGAKVLHPRALIPIAGTRITLHVRSFVNPDQPGTEVSARRSLSQYPVKALAIVRGQAIVTVAGKGMVGVHGIAARTFVAVDAEQLSVSTIFQASSESSIGFTLPEGEADRAVASLRAAFRDELAHGLIDNITARRGMAVVAVVGDGMAGAPGIAARVFSALAAASVNVVAIAQGSSERNISFVVSAEQATDAARRVHAAFQLSKIGGGGAPAAPRTDVVLLGFGRVGRALADQISAANGQSSVRVVGLLDRSGYIFEPRGLSRRRLTDLTRDKDAGALLTALGGKPAAAAEALSVMARHAVVAAGRRRRHQREHGRPPLHRAQQRVQRRPRQQEAARGIVEELRGAADRLDARRPAAEVRGHRRRRPADHRHLPEARRNRRSRDDDRRVRQRHADVRRLGRVGRQTVLAGRA